MLFSWPEFEYGRPALTWAEEFLTAHSTKATTEDGMEGFPCLPSELQGWVSRCLGYLGFFQGITLSFSIDSITYSTGHMIGLVWRCVLKPFWDFFWNWNLYDFYRFLYDFYMISIWCVCPQLDTTGYRFSQPRLEAYPPGVLLVCWGCSGNIRKACALIRSHERGIYIYICV